MPSIPAGFRDEAPLSAALVIRRRLYLLALTVCGIVAAFEPSITSVGLTVASAVGVAVGMVPPRSRRRRVLVLFGYELVAATLVTLAGQPLIGILIVVAASGATSMVKGARNVAIAAAGVAGAAITLLSVAFLDMEGLMPFDEAGRSLHLFGEVLGVSVAGALTAGVTAVFATQGAELEQRRRQLREWRDRQRHLMDEAPEPILVHGGAETLYANPAAGALLGCDAPADLVGRPLLELVDPEDRPRFGITVARALGGEGLAPFVIRFLARDGRALHVEVSGHLTEWNGEIAVQLALRDRTEIEESRAELRLLFERLPVALYRTLPSGEVLAANPALAELLGYRSVEEMLADPDGANRAHPDARTRVAWRRLIEAEGRIVGYEQEMVRRDGTRIRVSDTAQVVRDEHGNVAFYEGVLVDVTDRWEAERSRRRLGQILDATSDLVALADTAGRLRYANAAVRRFLGLGEDGPLPATSASRLLDAGAARALSEATREAARIGEWRGEVSVARADGEEAIVSAIVQHHPGDEAGPFLSLLGREVTEERRMAGRLADLLQEKDRFVASVSHELRTPLTAVVGVADELERMFDGFSDEERRELISLVSEQAREVAAIVEDLLVVARIDTDSIVLVDEVVDLSSTVPAVLRSLARTGKTIEIDVEGKVVADPGRLRQILRNLLTNAVRYGGDHITLRARDEGEWNVVEVSDDGPGLSADLWDRVFSPYVRGHDTGARSESVGIGLTVSRWLARQMGGDLDYRHDGESVFRLRLPSG